MGMYTEICLRIQLIDELDSNVVNVIRELVNGDSLSKIPKHPFFETSRYSSLMLCSSFYHIPKATMRLDTEGFSKSMYLHGRADLKNYDDEIEKFFDWIYPYCEEGMLGYSLYEEDVYPKIYTKQDGKLLCDRVVVSK
jgi:hypothetical protein